MVLVVFSAFLGVLAAVLVGVNWLVALKAISAARRKIDYHVSQLHLVPELLIVLAAMLWRTQYSLAPIAWFALCVVAADVLSWVVTRSASRPRLGGPRNAL